jgi:hypothetical protein
MQQVSFLLDGEEGGSDWEVMPKQGNQSSIPPTALRNGSKRIVYLHRQRKYFVVLCLER